MTPKKVTVIGAGLGGLAAAMQLAKCGLKVTLFEKNSTPGGKMNEHQFGPYRFDTGPSLLTMPFIVDELFSACGRERTDYIKFDKIDPTCRYFFPDKTVIDSFSATDKMVQLLQDTAPDQIKAYYKFIKYIEQLYHYAAEVFLFTPIHEIEKLLNLRNLRLLLNLYRLDAVRTVHQRLETIFSDPRLIQIFDRFATYNGSSPFLAPATLNIIAHVEMNMGGYYIRNGMYQLVRAMVEVCRELGVEIYYNAPVKQIIHENNICRGVIVNDEMFYSDYVVCNADVVTAFNTLINGFPVYSNKLNRLEPSLSGMVFLWSIKKKHPQLAHHNIFFSMDYEREFNDLFKERQPPHDPTVYLAITSRKDAHHAPKHGENWFVLLNMPYLSSRQNWTVAKAQMRQKVITRLMKFAIDVDKYIEHEVIFTPVDFEHKYGANKGSIYGISSNSRLTAFMRPANRNRQLTGLYFVGGASHPGGGIPLVLLSARFVSSMIAEKEGIKDLEFK